MRHVAGKATLHVNDPEGEHGGPNDPEDEHGGPNDPVWCHIVALTRNRLFDWYNPKGIFKTHLTQDEKPYFMHIKKSGA